MPQINKDDNRTDICKFVTLEKERTAAANTQTMKFSFQLKVFIAHTYGKLKFLIK